MNWTRGLLRLWLVLSILWICAAGLAAIFVWNSDARLRASAAQLAEREAECGPDAPNRGPWCNYADVERAYPAPFLVYTSFVLGPPIALFVLGWTGLWVARGFRER
jgi:hypothetical protein